MESRLDSLDDEMSRTEAALSALVAELEMPQTPAPRFQAAVAHGGAELRPERADCLVHRSHPSFSFTGRCDTPSVALGVATPSCSSESRNIRSSSSSRAPQLGGSCARAARWGPSPGDQRWHVRLHLGVAGQELGIVLEKRGPAEVAVVRCIQVNSPASIWNDSQQQDGRQLRPGDEILEVNGARIGVDLKSSGALRAALADTKYVHLVMRRSARQDAALREHAVEKQGETRVDEIAAKPQTPCRASRTRANEPNAVREERVETEGVVDGVGGDTMPEVFNSFLDKLPGRCCRAIPSQATHLYEKRHAPKLQVPLPGAGQCATFGSEARFSAAVPEEDGPALACPSDNFSSNRPTPRSAVIWPAPSTNQKAKNAMKALLADKCGELAVGTAATPGLRGLHSALLAEAREARGDEVSTDAGSEQGSLLSFWSSTASESSDHLGPGAYSPDFDVGRPRGGCGTPSFARYTARDQEDCSQVEEYGTYWRAHLRTCIDGKKHDVRGTLRTEREDAEKDLAQLQAGKALAAPAQTAPGCDAHAPTARNGLINPLHSHQPRVATDKAMQETLSSRRTFYEVNRSLVEQSVPTVLLGAESAETGRIEPVRATQDLGPGCYDVPALPKGPEAFIPPERVVGPALKDHREERQRSAPPGPAKYETDQAVGLVYPRLPVADFRQNRGHTMGFQAVPKYVVRYRALDPRWEAVRRRSLSATITPLSKQRAPIRPGSVLGPGSYDTVEESNLVKRLRPDLFVVRWVLPKHGEEEHTHALYDKRPVDRAIRGDPRELLDTEADHLVRRHHPCGIIMRPHTAAPLPPHPQPVRGHWRLYDLPELPTEPGAISFSRRLKFDEFRSREAIWRAREALRKRRLHTSNWLAYSLPDLEVIKERAPRPDFAKALGRPASDPGDDEPREGDVLQLSLDAERKLFHEKVPACVNMAKQLGRAGSCPPMFEEAGDDFDELVLDPRPVQRRVPVYVDMSKGSGRRENLDMSAHLWADEDGRLYAYQPTAGLRLREEGADELELSPQRGRRLTEPRPKHGNFSHALGRPGVDPRVAERDEHEDGDEVIFTHYQPRVRSRPPPSRYSQEVGGDRGGDGGGDVGGDGGGGDGGGDGGKPDPSSAAAAAAVAAARPLATAPAAAVRFEGGHDVGFAEETGPAGPEE